MKIRGIKMNEKTRNDIEKTLEMIFNGVFMLIIFTTNLMIFGVLYKFHPFILKSQELSILLMFGCAIACLISGYAYFKIFEK